MVAIQTCAECGRDLGSGSECPNCGPAPAATTRRTGLGFSVGAIICGVIAFFIFPYVLGPIGIVLGFVARRRGERWSTAALIVPTVALVLGLLLQLVLLRMLFTHRPS